MCSQLLAQGRRPAAPCRREEGRAARQLAWKGVIKPLEPRVQEIIWRNVSPRSTPALRHCANPLVIEIVPRIYYKDVEVGL